MVSYSSDPYDRAKEMLKVFLGLPKWDFFLSGSQVLLIKIRCPLSAWQYNAMQAYDCVLFL